MNLVEIQRSLIAQASVERSFLAKKNVVGVAIGRKESEGIFTDEVAVVALVREKVPLAQLSSSDIIPRTVDGVRTDVYEVGELRAQQTPRDRFRPTIPSGVSSGHFSITAGTLGVMVKDRSTGERLLLSNNHVFANSNDAQLGDSILQPGPTDGSSNPADKVATLHKFIPLRYIEDDSGGGGGGGGNGGGGGGGGDTPGCVGFFVTLTNLIAGITGSKQRVAVTATGAQSISASGRGDAPVMPAPVPVPPTVSAQAADNMLDGALARPVDPNMFLDDIVNIGTITGTKSPTLGMLVRKSGRTTGLTTGTVNLLNATVNVAYSTKNGNRTARFSGQIITEAMSQGGDSGSLIVDAVENKAVGLLFAGSPLATIFTPIDVVFAALDITF